MPDTRSEPPARRVVVIGAGAAGTMAAIFAAGAGAQTRLLERTSDGGRKILISGGGRCNILPSSVDESRFVTESPRHLLRKMVRSWPLREQIAFFEQDARIPLVEETGSAKLFPRSNRARDVRDRLLEMAKQQGATLRMNAAATGVEAEGGRWRIAVADGEPELADAVIIATGGLSVPATGSDGAGLTIARGLGHTIRTTYAALTPLTAATAPFAALSGVSLPVTLSGRDEHRAATATGGFLFTHRGYSGPAVLDVSHVAVRSRQEHDRSATLRVRWSALGEREWTTALEPQGAKSIGGAIASVLPARLADALVARCGLDPRLTLANLSRRDRLRLIDELVRGELPWDGDEGYRKAEVTGGGVALDEVDPRTLESRRQPGLYFCGEVLDAFGPIGGYNFLWAWATGRAAGLAAAANLL